MSFVVGLEACRQYPAVGSRRRRLGVYHASRTFRQQTQSRPDQANPGAGGSPWGVTEKSQEDAGSGGRNFGSRIRRGQADPTNSWMHLLSSLRNGFRAEFLW